MVTHTRRMAQVPVRRPAATNGQSAGAETSGDERLSAGAERRSWHSATNSTTIPQGKGLSKRSAAEMENAALSEEQTQEKNGTSACVEVNGDAYATNGPSACKETSGGDERPKCRCGNQRRRTAK